MRQAGPPTSGGGRDAEPAAQADDILADIDKQMAEAVSAGRLDPARAGELVAQITDQLAALAGDRWQASTTRDSGTPGPSTRR